MPTFSVIIPAYNRSSTIGATLNTVQNQTFRDFECIIVDDGSKDADALKAVVARMGDDRFIYVKRSNGGASAARNTGIDLAIGRYLAFLDSDDLFFPHKLETDLLALGQAADPSTVIFSPVQVDRGFKRYWIYPKAPPKPRQNIADYLIRHRGFTQTSTLVVERQLAKLVRFREGLPMGQDVDFPIRLEQAGAHFVMKPFPTTRWVDTADPDRVSNMPPYKPMLAWADEMRPVIGDPCFYSFRATHIARLAAPTDFAEAAVMLLEGLIKGRMSIDTAAKAITQVMIPRRWYRAIFDVLVRIRGHGN